MTKSPTALSPLPICSQRRKTKAKNSLLASKTFVEKCPLSAFPPSLIRSQSKPHATDALLPAGRELQEGERKASRTEDILSPSHVRLRSPILRIRSEMPPERKGVTFYDSYSEKRAARGRAEACLDERPTPFKHSYEA